LVIRVWLRDDSSPRFLARLLEVDEAEVGSTTREAVVADPEQVLEEVKAWLLSIQGY
jgi:hypothetical protein